MLVKDESARIRETLLSARAYVDAYCILDTGSTDGTQEIVRRTMRGVLGALHEDPSMAIPPSDYATSRNRVLDLAVGQESPSVFTLFLSGDEVLCEGRALREYLEGERDKTEGAYNTELRMEGKRWFFPRVLRTGGGWKYSGKLHEHPTLEGRPHFIEEATCPSAYIRHDVSDQSKRNVVLLEQHLPVLERAINEDPTDQWALYYLGQTYGHLADQIDEPGTALTFRLLAMSYYHRHALLLIADVKKGDAEATEMFRYVRRKFLYIAKKSEIFAPMEVFGRLAAFCREYPDDAEGRLLRLEAMAVVTPRARMQEMIDEALASADVARAVKGKRSSLPANEEAEWQSLFVAAQSAAYLAQQNAESRAPDGALHADKLLEYIRRGIEAGGPESVFRMLSAKPGGQTILPMPEVVRGGPSPEAA